MGHAMNARKDFIEYEAVLQHCLERTMGGYEPAVVYGKLSGYFTPDNRLTAMGQTVAGWLDEGLFS